MNSLTSISDKIYDNQSLDLKLKDWRSGNKKIVFTNGVFDLLHLGHIDYLSKAKDNGDILFVGVNSDVSAKKLGKGSSRPITNEKSRSMIIAALEFVDAVMLFDEDTPLELIKIVMPDILVKGGDYKLEDIVGYDVVMAKGGTIKTIDLLPGYSSTAIEQKIKKH
ncbi:MAG TPA: D-glycero-beta-D-manno-heptose 1-phosphate adenylyltransferase [Bacteroidales bacterium]|jgi:rfaE bifunctional protein nucleotidyltransferase chain/domain|nr:D-glycero-beta-D-manno-heptose 1-phosphate adenylyltransferase [Bacteroidota bacterium]HJN06793.1 D-glycero-beta-D-manno-heptose 1-phosphate adenylyltransferase [Bacteroidales bacterium]|tara:strand:- start:383 stop:877 length:495 start_codon:yes stop_codon:yes gene_type:complete